MEGNRDSGHRPEFVNTGYIERSNHGSTLIAKVFDDNQDTNSADVEAQSPSRSIRVIAPEYSIPTKTKSLYLGLYFALNLALTLYNKAVLGKVR